MTTNSQKMTLSAALARVEDGPISGTVMAAKAKLISSLAHLGQVDGIGAPYSGHVLRVAARAEGIRGRMTEPLDRFEVEAVALLHDVLEDTCVTSDELRIAGFPASVVQAVNALTHRGEERALYLSRLARDPLARLVKISDTIDNTDPVRLAAVTDPARRARLAVKYDGQMELLLDASEGTITRDMF